MRVPIRVRFSPTPSPRLHVGLARTGILCWVLARSMNGSLVLRFDGAHLDPTDRIISPILDGLRWLGLDWDEGPDVGGEYGPYLQSERLSLYQYWANELVKRGLAYICTCSEERLASLRKHHRGYDGHCRDLSLPPVGNYAIRFRVSNTGETVVPDLVHGPIAFSNSNLSDPVILRANGVPTYQFAYVVDDHLMKITHAIRDGRASSTQVMVQLFQALNWQIPDHIHWSTVMAPGGKSKLHSTVYNVGSRSLDIAYVEEYRRLGYLPQTVVNLLMLTGYKHTAELFTLTDLVERFDTTRIRKGNSSLPVHMLNKLNHIHLRSLPLDQFEDLLQRELIKHSFDRNLYRLASLAAPVQKEATTLMDAVDLICFAFVDHINAQPSSLPSKIPPHVACKALTVLVDEIETSRQWDTWTVRQAIQCTSTRIGLDFYDVVDILRVALTGDRYGLEISIITSVLKYSEVRKRILSAINVFSGS